MNLEMRSSRFARALARLYNRLPLKRHVLKLVAHLEGGDMTSLTLRLLLREHCGVEVGAFSYGALLELGMADRGTKIGSYVSCGPNVRRIGAAHPLHHLLLHPFWYNPALGLVDASRDVHRTECRIGNDVWIGANATILPGCSHIGDGAVIAAGAIVTRDVPAFHVVAGVPARKISERLTGEERKRLSGISDWNTTPVTLSRKLGLDDHGPGDDLSS